MTLSWLGGWEWGDDPMMVSLFAHLLILANKEAVRYHGDTIGRGDVLTSLAHLSEVTGITVRSLRTCLARLEDMNAICQKSTNKYRIITICGFDGYDEEKIEGDKQLTSNRQATDRQGEEKEEAIQGTCTHVLIPDDLFNNNISSNNLENKVNKEKSQKKETKEKDITLGVVGEDDPMYGPFKAWLEYKRERRQGYKGVRSLKVCLNKLIRFSGGDAERARRIVEESVSNNWAGLFPPRDPMGDPRGRRSDRGSTFGGW